jgi:hypothetical protein
MSGQDPVFVSHELSNEAPGSTKGRELRSAKWLSAS